jgi:two-component system cell cycle response regulator CtrA
MRALIVTADAFAAAIIKVIPAAENLICDTTEFGEDGLEIGKLSDYDIILFDLMRPEIQGYEVLRRLRAAPITVPILILSGVAELDDKIKGLGFGADDFLTKPFDACELVARIQAIVRRSKRHAESVIRTGKLVVNLNTRVVSVDNQPLHLTGKEYSILELLSLRKGTILTKEMFLQSPLWRDRRTRTQDYRRLPLPSAQKARPSDWRQTLHRDCVGPRLCVARPGTHVGSVTRGGPGRLSCAPRRGCHRSRLRNAPLGKLAGHFPKLHRHPVRPATPAAHAG